MKSSHDCPLHKWSQDDADARASSLALAASSACTLALASGLCPTTLLAGLTAAAAVDARIAVQAAAFGKFCCAFLPCANLFFAEDSELAAEEKRVEAQIQEITASSAELKEVRGHWRPMPCARQIDIELPTDCSTVSQLLCAPVYASQRAATTCCAA